MNIKSFSKNKSYKGFTLIEIVISLAIFSIVATVALGALVKIMGANRKAQTLQASMTNINFALESMTRELRTGSTIYCQTGTTGININNSDLSPTGCVANNSDGMSGALIAFQSTKTITTGPQSPCRLKYVYRFKPNTSAPGTWLLEKAAQTACTTSIPSGSTLYSSIISDDVVIEGYDMRVISADSYPLIFLSIRGYAGIKERDRTYFKLQTAASPRTP